MANKGRSERGMFGTINHYDERGKKIGHSDPGLFGGYTNYDAKGKRVGRSSPGMFGSYNHYDNRGHKIGRSDPSLFGSYTHKDARGRSTGSSNPGAFGSYRHTDSQGCYVATCVYGSYDCPQVWTLRRFRDYVLARIMLGRMFIQVYYRVSPTIVKWFGKNVVVKKLWRDVLDCMVERLNKKGVESTPYEDREW